MKIEGLDVYYDLMFVSLQNFAELLFTRRSTKLWTFMA